MQEQICQLSAAAEQSKNGETPLIAQRMMQRKAAEQAAKAALEANGQPPVGESPPADATPVDAEAPRRRPVGREPD